MAFAGLKKAKDRNDLIAWVHRNTLEHLLTLSQVHGREFRTIGPIGQPVWTFANPPYRRSASKRPCAPYRRVEEDYRRHSSRGICKHTL